MDERPARLVDEEGLRRFLRRELGPVDEFEIEQADGGIANETVFLTWGDRKLVLRRPPTESTADNAHQILRDYTFFEALQETPIPVPRPVVKCTDESVIGSEFYIAERIDGVVPHPDEPLAFAEPDIRRKVSCIVVETLADIHQLDPRAIGLSEFGNPGGFTRRQVRQWETQIEWATATTVDTRAVPALTEIGDWLHANIPQATPDPAVVHGDYGLHNLMFSTGDAVALAGVLDWEMGTIGNPLVDLGWLLTFWPDTPDAEIATPELIPSYVDQEGYLSQRDLVAQYESVADVRVENPRFYKVLGTYKLAAVGEMFFARYLQAGNDNPLFEKMRTKVPAYVQYAKRLIHADDPLSV